MSNTKEKDDNLTVSRVYDTLKSPEFLKKLYWDILSGIRDKDTYKLMREFAEGLINQNMKGIASLGSNDEDTKRRKDIIAEISVMSYTIDTVFSKILYMKLEKACKEQIVKIIHELRQEGKIPEDVWSRINLNTEASGSQASTENALVKANSDQLNKECPKKNIPNKYPVATLTKENVKKLQNSIHNVTSKSFFGSDTQDSSDEDSEISIGGCESIVSSVHTSDLSSFDDKISLSSDEENGEKKKLPLKEVQKRYYKTRALDSSENKKVVESDKSEIKEKTIESVPEDSNKTKKVSKNNAAMSTKQFPISESSNGNGLSKRARKPNSKYSSDNILCTVVKVKERKKPLKTYSKMLNNELSPPYKKAKVDNVCRGTVTTSKSANNEETSNNVKTPSKQPENLGLFKSHSANRSLTSRRTAPLTLFST